jgi:hypothetical protein
MLSHRIKTEEIEEIEEIEIEQIAAYKIILTLAFALSYES